MMLSEIVAYTALIVVILLSIRKPMIGVAAYWILALARPHDVYWYSLAGSRLSFLVGLVVTVMWALAWLRGSFRDQGVTALDVLVVLFLALKVVAATVAADQIAAWDHVEKVAKIVLFYVVTVCLVGRRTDFRTMCLVTAFSLAFLGFWGNWQWYVEGIGGGSGGELAGPGWEVAAALSDRNVFGYMLGIGLPICFYTFIVERRLWLRWPALGSLPFLANAVMLTFGRAAFVGVMAGSLCAVVRLRRVALVLAGVLVGGLMMYQLAGPAVIARISTIEQYDEDGSAQSRLESWKAGFGMMSENPLLGVGPGNYGRFSRLYNPEVPEGLVAHNEFIEAAAESGILAGLVLIAIVVLAFFNLRWVRKRTWTDPERRWAYYYAAMIESSLVSYLVGALFVSLPFFELFYLLVGLTVVLRRIVARELQEATAPATPEGEGGAELRPAAVSGQG